MLNLRSFGYGHSFGVLSHYYGREEGLELREDIDTVLEPGMVSRAVGTTVKTRVHCWLWYFEVSVNVRWFQWSR